VGASKKVSSRKEEGVLQNANSSELILFYFKLYKYTLSVNILIKMGAAFTKKKISSITVVDADNPLGSVMTPVDI
jgi:hypothetical protein